MTRNTQQTEYLEMEVNNELFKPTTGHRPV